jgi:hypothetical protein
MGDPSGAEYDEQIRNALWSRDLPRLVDLMAKADLAAVDLSGWTPLHIAAHIGHLDAVMLLLQAGADPATREMHGCTPAQLAEERNHQTVALLLTRAEKLRRPPPVQSHLDAKSIKPPRP